MRQLRTVKVVVVAAMLALAVTALAGAGTAGAAASVVTGCLGTLKITGEQMECVGTYDLGTKMSIGAEAVKPTLGGVMAESCGGSGLSVELLTGLEAGLEGTLSLTKLSFSGECGPCSKVEVSGLPSSNGSVLMPTEAEDDFALESGAIGLTLSGCPLAMTCKFSMKNGQFNYELSKEFTSNELRAEGIVLEKVSGGEFCGTSSKLTANYVAFSPKQWWLGLAE
jgi:hypothetical protein